MNSNFSRNEQGELIHAAQIMLAKQRQRTKNSLYANKRTYKRWSEYEKYSLQLALLQYGMSLPNLEKVFINKHGQVTRTANQVSNFSFDLILIFHSTAFDIYFFLTVSR